MSRNRMKRYGGTLWLAGGLLLSLLAIGYVLAAAAPDPLEESRPTNEHPGDHVTTLPADVMALGIGKPTSLAMVESWVSTYDNALDDGYVTRPFWYDDELLAVWFAHYVPGPSAGKDESYSVHIKDSRGNPVYSFETPGIAATGGITFTSVVVTPGPPGSPPGPLPAGAYKVSVTIRMGNKSVGQSYWLFVLPRPGI